MSAAKAQCNVYIQMVHAVECVLPQVVSTQEILLPCSAPVGFSQLKAGDFAYIDFTDTTCNSICLQGRAVTITCLSIPLATENPGLQNAINVFPTLVQSYITIEGKDIRKAEVYNDCGVRMMTYMESPLTTIHVEDLSPGIYFVKLWTQQEMQIKKIIKL